MIKKRGIALIWSLVLCSILLIISGTMVSYIIKESQFSVRITESTSAYAYAKSGADWAINCYQNTTGVGVTPIDIKIDKENKIEANCKIDLDFDDDGLDDTIVTTTGDGVAGSKIFTVGSESTISSVTRKVAYEMIDPTKLKYYNYEDFDLIPSGLFTLLPDDAPIDIIENQAIGSNKESFTLQFDMWIDPWYPAVGHKIDDLMFGLNPPVTEIPPIDNKYSDAEMGNTSYIAFRSNYQAYGLSDPRYNTIVLEAFDGTNFYSDIVEVRPGTKFDLENEPGITDNTPNGTRAFNSAASENRYRVILKYIKGTAASLRINRRRDSDDTFECAGYASIDLSGNNIDFGNLSTLFWWEPARNMVPGSASDMIYANDKDIIKESDSNFIMLGSENTRYRIDNIIIIK